MYITILFIIFWALVYNYIGETEYGNGILLMVLSIMLSCVIFFVFGWGILASILGQLGIGAILTLLKIFRKDPPAAL